MVKIAKFGGSSVASAEQFRKIKKIIEADDSRRFVVVSAAGKRNKEDNKVTDYSTSVMHISSIPCPVRESFPLWRSVIRKLKRIWD